MKNLSSQQIITVAVIAVLLVVTPIALRLSQQKQQNNTHAEANTSLSFAQPTSTTATNNVQGSVGSTTSLDLLINPGTNTVSFVKAEIDYDPTKIAITNANQFQLNTNAFSQIVEGPVFSPGKVTITLSIGSDPSKAITQPTKIGTITFNIIADTGSQGTTISYGPSSQALAIGANSTSNENVLANKASVVILANGQPPTQVCGTAPTDTMLIIDRSGSMNDKIGSNGTKISNAKTSADNFIDILSANTQDSIGLDSFSSTATLNSPLTNNYSSVKSQVNNINADGNTCLQCAIDQTNQEIASHGRSNIKKVVVVLTDGIANTIEGSTNQTSTNIAQQKALDAAQAGHNNSGTIFFTIGLGNDVNGSFLKQIADTTGGQYYFSPTTDQLNGIYQQISQIIAKGSISGTVFNDTNNNGVFDTGERPLPGWIVQLFTGSSTVPQNVTTDSQGQFAINNLCDGGYTLKEIQQPGWTQTSPTNSNGYTINIVNGSTASNENFGNYLAPTPTPTSTPTPTNTPIPTNTPTPTIIPTATPIPGNTRILLNVLLHGIGSSGDNANLASSLSNKRPLHATKIISASIFNVNNQLVATGSGQVLYSSASGSFTGAIDLGTSITTGNYNVKITMNQHLTRLIPGIQSITESATNQMPDATLITGDANNDNQLSILDYNMLLDCYSDLSPAQNCSDPNKKLATDFNDDGFVNQIDYNLFLREISNQPGE